MEGQLTTNLRYADDTIHLAKSDEISLSFELAFHREKTTIMVVDREGHMTIIPPYIANCEMVQSYIHFGSSLSNVGGYEKKIRRRCVTRSPVGTLDKIWELG